MKDKKVNLPMIFMGFGIIGDLLNLVLQGNEIYSRILFGIAAFSYGVLLVGLVMEKNKKTKAL